MVQTCQVDITSNSTGNINIVFKKSWKTRGKDGEIDSVKETSSGLRQRQQALKTFINIAEPSSATTDRLTKNKDHKMP